MAQAKRSDQTRDRRQFTISLARLNAVLTASGDIQSGALKASDTVIAFVGGDNLVIVRDRVTAREVPNSEPE